MTKKPGKNVAKTYERSSKEQKRLDELSAKMKARVEIPFIKSTSDGGDVTVSLDHEDDKTGSGLLMAAFGTTSGVFASGLLGQIAKVEMQDGVVKDDRTNFLLAAVDGVQPRDEIEAMLAAQMAAVHMATMTFAQKLASAEYVSQQDSAERALNKLARTFATQVEALKRYRTGGEQKVTVEHVTVNDGGQAIVGNVEAGGRGSAKK